MDSVNYVIIYNGKVIDHASCIEEARELGTMYVKRYNSPNVRISKE